MSDRGEFTITPDEAAGLVGQPGVSFVDASWYMPAQNRDGREEFNRIRIPGAVFFDIDSLSDQESDLPHMLPTPEDFAESVEKLGIASTNTIIVYDGPGLFSCARAWWMFKVMGANDAKVLDGGLDRWIAEGFPAERGVPEPVPPAHFEARFDPARVKGLDDMRANLKTGNALVLDARSSERFTGTVEEPRPGLRSGHIPGSLSLPFTELVEDGRLKDVEQLRAIFADRHLRGDREVVTSCGSGVTAAVLSLALATIGHDRHSLYDGSWSEWGKEDSVPVARWDDSEH